MVKLENIKKSYKDKVIVKDFSLEINEKEFLVLLGPSGSGKTTLLRLIAGLESLDEGRIFIEGRDVSKIPTQVRGIGMVFQDLALWPHMTVWDNIAFGLSAQKVDKKEQEIRIKEGLEAVHLHQHLKAYPQELSGGEKQRVALARALVLKPKVLLMDEPLSSLDPLLKDTIQILLKEVHSEFGMTTIYVTHQQTEALELGERVAVINQGELIQSGTYQELLDNPLNDFVKKFVRRR